MQNSELIPGELIQIDDDPSSSPCRVLSVGKKRSVKKLWGDQEVLTLSAATILYPILPGMVVFVISGNEPVCTVVVEALGDKIGAPRRFLVQSETDERRVDVSELIVPPPEPNDIIRSFKQLLWRGPRRFFSRINFRDQLARWMEDSNGLPMFQSARVKPLAHQVYAVRRILHERVPRFLLADEVGLGKTVEAGLAIQALMMFDPELSVLIIAPGSMTRQWLSEVYLRFGGCAFTLVDHQRIQGKSPVEVSRLLSSPRLILSSTALVQDALRELLLQRSLGLLVIDEAHHYPVDHPVYPFLVSLSRKARGLLALSATPSKQHANGLYGLLTLVAPDLYPPSNCEVWLKNLAIKREIWDRLSFTIGFQEEVEMDGDDLDQEQLTEIAQEWAFLEEDPIIAGMLGQIKEGSHETVDELISYVQEFYRVDHRIIRTRRVTLNDLGQPHCKRTYEFLEYHASVEEVLLGEHLEELSRYGSLNRLQMELRGLYFRFFNTTPSKFIEILTLRESHLNKGGSSSLEPPFNGLISTEPGPYEEYQFIKAIVETTPPLPDESKWLKDAMNLAQDWAKISTPLCARLNKAAAWLETYFGDHADSKVLIFSQSGEVVEEILTHLKAGLTYNIVAFHVGQDEEEQKKAVTFFQQRSSVRVLISDELGGEGRNFQMADVIIHLDHPNSVAQVEQRVGRLDRIGRDPEQPVHSVVLHGSFSWEVELLKIHAKVFQVYQRSIGGLEFVLPDLQKQIHEAACTSVSALTEIMGALSEKVTNTLAEVDEEFELALDTSRIQLEEALEIVELLEESRTANTADVIRQWGRALEVEFKTRGDVHKIFWTGDGLKQPLPGLEDRSGVAFEGTFIANRALEDETIHLFGPGHMVINSLARALDAFDVGRATVFKRDLGYKYKNCPFLICAIHCRPNENLLDDSGFMSMRLARMYQWIWPETQRVFFSLNPPMIIKDSQLLEKLDSDYQGGRFDKKLEPLELHERFDLLELWRAVETCTQMALAYVKEQRQPLIEQVYEEAQKGLRYDFGFLTGLEMREGRSGEIAKELAALKSLLDSIQQEQLTLEAAAVVIGA